MIGLVHTTFKEGTVNKRPPLLPRIKKAEYPYLKQVNKEYFPADKEKGGTWRDNESINQYCTLVGENKLL